MVLFVPLNRHCAHEYERCNDMASAALAYKCMEVAHMRIVYSNDLAASRDRVELDKAVRAAPQGNEWTKMNSQGLVSYSFLLFFFFLNG